MLKANCYITYITLTLPVLTCSLRGRERIMLGLRRNWIHSPGPWLVLIVLLWQKHWAAQVHITIITLTEGAIAVIGLSYVVQAGLSVNGEISRSFERRVAGASVLLQSAIFGAHWLGTIKKIHVKISSGLLVASLLFSILRRRRCLLNRYSSLVTSIYLFMQLRYLVQVQRSQIDFYVPRIETSDLSLMQCIQLDQHLWILLRIYWWTYWLWWTTFHLCCQSDSLLIMINAISSIRRTHVFLSTDD